MHTQEHVTWPARLKRCALDVSLYVAAICGVAIALWVVLAHVMNLHLVVVLTGSMEPAVPAGSVVMSQTVPASDVSVGDIITTPRPGYTLPVTHRVIEVADAAPEGSEHRKFILRGDANPINDPEPYTISSADRAVVVIPHVGGWLTQWITPAVGLTGIVAVSALVTWAFWPRKQVT